MAQTVELVRITNSRAGIRSPYVSAAVDSKIYHRLPGRVWNRTTSMWEFDVHPDAVPVLYEIVVRYFPKLVVRGTMYPDSKPTDITVGRRVRPFSIAAAIGLLDNPVQVDVAALGIGDAVYADRCWHEVKVVDVGSKIVSIEAVGNVQCDCGAVLRWAQAPVWAVVAPAVASVAPEVWMLRAQAAETACESKDAVRTELERELIATKKMLKQAQSLLAEERSARHLAERRISELLVEVKAAAANAGRYAMAAAAIARWLGAVSATGCDGTSRRFALLEPYDVPGRPD